MPAPRVHPKQSRHTGPKPNLSKALHSRMNQVDPATMLSSAHLVILLTSVFASIFNLRILYKLGLLCLMGVHGWSMFGAWKANGRKMSLELVQQPALPFLVLSALLWWFTRVALMPLQLALGMHSGLALLKSAAQNSAAASHPGLKAQSQQIKEIVRVAEPKALAIASHLELLSVPWSVLKALSGAQGLLLPVFVIQFVRFQMLTQSRMQAAWAAWCKAAVAGLGWAEKQPGVPPTVRAVLLRTKEQLSSSPKSTSVPKSD